MPLPGKGKFNRKPGGGQSARGKSAGRRGPSSRMGFRRKPNRFLAVFPERHKVVDYKDTERLSKFLTEKGRIIPRRITGMTAKQQRILVRAIKRARHAGLIAFQAE